MSKRLHTDGGEKSRRFRSLVRLRTRLLDEIDKAEGELLHAAWCQRHWPSPTRLNRAARRYGRLIDEHMMTIREPTPPVRLRRPRRTQ